MKKIVIASACRTAIGKFGGTLANVPAAELGSIVIKEALNRANVKPEQVDHVYMGCVIQAGLGQNVARQASLKAGLPIETPAVTVNVVCGSGLNCVNMAAQMIEAGDADIVVAGGMENMDMAPFAMMKGRYGYRMGSPMGKSELVDTMVNDALWDATGFNMHMGMTAENVCTNETYQKKYGYNPISREQLDEFAFHSQEKAAKAIADGAFKDEIVPVVIKGKKGDTVFDTDEGPRMSSMEVLGKLKPCFKKDGIVTAANSSAINNGAAAAIIWAVFNSLACIFFGLFAEYIPTVRRIMQSKVMFYFIGFLTVFQTWTQMSGIYEIFGDTPIGTTGGTLIVYGTCLVFLFMLLKEGMIRNVLSDGFSWVVVYGLLAVVVIAALVYTHGAFVNIDPGLTAAGIQTGLYKGFLLLPGPFTYPYYYSLFSYNDKNEDGTQHGNMKKSFVLAGVMFGVYMVLAALLTWVNFSPLLNTLKAILITIIALSSLSTYLYSEYLVFGENIGFLIDVLTVTSWQLVIPLGVMGIWTLMSELRVYIIIFVLLASVVLHLVSDRKEDAR